MVREAGIDDIKGIQIVRNSVTENTLSSPNLLTDRDCEGFNSSFIFFFPFNIKLLGTIWFR